LWTVTVVVVVVVATNCWAAVAGSLPAFRSPEWLAGTMVFAAAAPEVAGNTVAVVATAVAVVATTVAVGSSCCTVAVGPAVRSNSVAEIAAAATGAVATAGVGAAVAATWTVVAVPIVAFVVAIVSAGNNSIVAVGHRRPAVVGNTVGRPAAVGRMRPRWRWW